MKEQNKGYLAPEEESTTDMIQPALTEKESDEFYKEITDDIEFDAEEICRVWFRNKRLGIKRMQCQAESLEQAIHEDVAEVRWVWQKRLVKQ